MKQIKKYWNWLPGKQKKAESITQSTETNTGGLVSSEQQKQQDSQLQATFHQSIQTLLYSDYLNIILTGELSHLIINGTPSLISLSEAWKNIQDEYSDSIKHPKSESIFEAGKSLVYNQWKIGFISLCLEELKKEYDAAIAEKVMGLGYDLIVEKENREDYLRQVYSIETEAKFLIIQQNQLYNEYKRISGNDEAPVKRELVDYEKELRILSKYMGYSIKKNQITVIEFCSLLNAYIEEIESLKKKDDE